jgi:glycosyltransferase involved in cell wall biosynthesis
MTSTSPVRITHVVAPARFGGLETVVEALAKGQRSAGHSVTVVGVFSETPSQHPFWQSIETSPGVRAVPVVLPGRAYIAERRALRRILAETRAQVVHTHGYRPDVLTSPEGRRVGAATVTTVHGFSGGSLKNRAYEWLQRRTFRTLDGVVAVSSKLERELIASGIPDDLVWCIPNAWASPADPLPKRAARDTLGLPQGVPVIGWVGRMSRAKAPDVMLEAFACLEDQEARLSLIGDGPLRAPLELRMRNHEVARRVHWHGMVPDASRLLTAFDVLAISSWTEGTPMILLEAMAAGVPVVTTAVGGIPDVVSRTEAVLVDAGDPRGIARALGYVLAGPSEAAERADAAQVRLGRDFAVEPWVRRYEEVYRSCLSRSRTYGPGTGTDALSLNRKRDRK